MSNRLVTVTQNDPAYIAYDILRTRVHQTMKQNNWRTLAVTSPSQGCGKSTTAANLAVSFAKCHQGRVALVDFDLRRPAVARIFGIDNPPVLEDFLTGQLQVDDVFVRYDENLAVAGNSTPATYPSALIQSASTAKAISDIRVLLDPDLIIFDLPPMLVADDVEAFLPDVDATILIAGAGVSTPTEITRCERQLAQSSNLLGVVMNACQHMPQTGYY